MRLLFFSFFSLLLLLLRFASPVRLDDATEAAIANKEAAVGSLLGVVKRFYNDSEPFTFIQIGANVGATATDPLYPAPLLKRNWRGVLLEPLPEYFKELRRNYRAPEEALCALDAHGEPSCGNLSELCTLDRLGSQLCGSLVFENAAVCSGSEPQAMLRPRVGVNPYRPSCASASGGGGGGGDGDDPYPDCSKAPTWLAGAGSLMEHAGATQRLLAAEGLSHLMEKTTVACTTLEGLFRRHGLLLPVEEQQRNAPLPPRSSLSSPSSLDLFLVDAEGADAAIVEAMLETPVRPRLVFFESRRAVAAVAAKPMAEPGQQHQYEDGGSSLAHGQLAARLLDAGYECSLASLEDVLCIFRGGESDQDLEAAAEPPPPRMTSSGEPRLRLGDISFWHEVDRGGRQTARVWPDVRVCVAVAAGERGSILSDVSSKEECLATEGRLWGATGEDSFAEDAASFLDPKLHPEAQHLQAVRFYEEQNFERAKAWWEKAGEQGHAIAAFNLGLIYATGLHGVVEKDHDMAKMWYEKAAEQGHADAQAWVERERNATGELRRYPNPK